MFCLFSYCVLSCLDSKKFFIYWDNYPFVSFLSCKYFLFLCLITDSGWPSGEGSFCQSRSHWRRGLDLWVRKIPWRRKWQPTPRFLHGKPHVPGASMGNPAHDKGHEEGGLTNTEAGSGLRGPPGFSWASTPQIRVCLLYCVMLSTYSSDINRGLSPHHFFLEKVNLELLDNKSPGHNKSVSIQKSLWWLSSLPDRFMRTLTATYVIVYSLPIVRGTESLKHPRNVGASEESKSLE